MAADGGIGGTVLSRYTGAVLKVHCIMGEDQTLWSYNYRVYCEFFDWVHVVMTCTNPRSGVTSHSPTTALGEECTGEHDDMWKEFFTAHKVEYRVN